jgi:hypothetical protein
MQWWGANVLKDQSQDQKGTNLIGKSTRASLPISQENLIS